MRPWLPLALLLAGLPAAAQGVPEALRGSWAQGACAAPEAVLHLTGRSLVRLPADGPARLLRFRSLGMRDGWVVATGGGAEAPRVMLRPAGDGLETIEPDAKTRDDRLPGDLPVRRWSRCAAAPPLLAALHGEGLAFLGTLERLEAACQQGSSAPCLAALMAGADVSGDGRLSVAEVARLLRGAAWAVAALEEAPPEGLGSAVALGGAAALVAARLLVEGIDFDGEGRLSPAELAQDRAAWPAAAGSAEGRPAALESFAVGIGLLRVLAERLGTE